ncbi:MAG: NAD(+) synthase [Anaerolineales bacterium]|nr:MAG: NAD(+) synthase [Anaerolineales bacterium]
MASPGDAAAVAASCLLRIDEERAVDVIRRNLAEAVSRTGVTGVLLGLSGGIDSALLAALAVRGLGRDAVHVAYLFDRDSGRSLALNVRRVADWLGIRLERVSIEAAVRERGAYDSAVTRLTRLSPLVGRLLHAAYRAIAGETPFVSSLRAGAGGDGGAGRAAAIRKAIGAYSGQGFDIRHRYRREYLEVLASDRGWVLLGAANRSEWKIGWFVDGGVDGLPLPTQPIAGLYKTQVRQLAGFLGVPERVRTQPPSPDMMKGFTDEYGLGMSYSKIDLALDRIEGGVSDDDLATAGVTDRDVEWVREMVGLSAWKRIGESAGFVVDGGPGGGLRVGMS